MLLLILLIIIIFIGTYWYLIKPHNYWRERNVVQQPLLRILYVDLNFAFHFEPFYYQIEQSYRKFADKRFFGTYQFAKRTLFLRDPELIKQITVKDFDHFLDHNNFLPDGLDPLWNKNLFVLRGQKWREMRSTLSPVFTSSKIKQMYVLIKHNAQQFTKYFNKSDDSVVMVEMKDAFTRFTNDVIANVAFGIECDSLEVKDNDFYMNGKKAVDFNTVKRAIDFALLAFCPSLAKLLDIRVFSKDITDFFLNIITENIQKRKQFNIKRPDLLNLLIEARDQGLKNDDDGNDDINNKIEWNDIDITAQALIFFFAGFESVSSLMSFMAYELAINPDVQEKLYLEIMDVIDKHHDNIEYDQIIKMKYMDMVISETLRKWPVAAAIDRLCTKSYQMDLGDQQLLIEKDTVILLPIYALHRDPKYFPQPERFNPERFNDDNKLTILPYTYLPFGSGPRNCIGNRLALLEAKVLFFHILKDFEIVVVEKTQIPLKLSRISFNLSAENGIWLGLKKREKL